MSLAVSKAAMEDMDDLISMSTRFAEQSKLSSLLGFNAVATREFYKDIIGSNEWRVIFIARDGTKPVGMIGLVMVPIFFSPETAMCTELFWWVEPDYRKKGVGRELVMRGEAWAVASGADIMTMVAHESSEPERASALYAKAGYRLFETSWAKEVV